MADDIAIRQLAEGDWDDIVPLERQAYSPGGLSEGEAALRSYAAIAPTTCFVLQHGGLFGGYLLALPYRRFRCPDLGGTEHAWAHSSNIHTHDMVIAEVLRGRGLGSILLTHLAEHARARGFESASLVAVHGTDVLWSPLGYQPFPEVTLPQSYGARAIYMSMALSPSAQCQRPRSRLGDAELRGEWTDD